MPSLAPADGPAPAAHAAKKKKKKPLIATVKGTFTVRYNNPAGFGNDAGANWQELKVQVKETEIPFRAGDTDSAAAKGVVDFEYQAEAHTLDRSYALGCDSEDRQTYGGYDDEAVVSIRKSRWLQTNGVSKKYFGWEVTAAAPPQGIFTVSKGSYLEWDSILMDTCATIEKNEPLGTWSPGFVQPDGLGKLNSDDRSVKLTAINTALDQTGTVTGSIKFNKDVD